MISSVCRNGGTIPAIGHDTKRLTDERTTQFTHLLQLNHTNYSILYNNYRFHNHSPHFLGSAYLYGGSSKHLNDIYDDMVARDNLERWISSPGQITSNNYRTHLGKGEYQRAWVDFLKGRMQTDHNWQGVVSDLLFTSGPEGEINAAPMFRCLNTALGHPLIHLGYAFELNSLELGAEALGLVATCYDEKFAALLSTRSDSESRTPKPTSDIFEIFQRIFIDQTLPTYSQPGDDHIDEILNDQSHVDTVVSHLNSWDIVDPILQLSQAYCFASLLLVSTSPQLVEHGYDFFLVHLLTTAHAVRVLFPHLPSQHHASILKGWLLTAILAYIAQNRPALDLSYVKSFDLQRRDWQYVREEALRGEYSMDAHFVKACRALLIGAETWKIEEDPDWFLRCAVKFASEFDGWGGFDAEAEDAELVKEQRKKDGIYVRQGPVGSTRK